VIIKCEYFLPECTVVFRSRLNTRNKYKVHLQTFIHARLQQPSRCSPPCWWCIPAERWNGEKHDCLPPSLWNRSRACEGQTGFESVSVAVCVDCDEFGVNERGRPFTFTAHAHTHTSQENEVEEAEK